MGLGLQLLPDALLRHLLLQPVRDKLGHLSLIAHGLLFHLGQKEPVVYRLISAHLHSLLIVSL